MKSSKTGVSAIKGVINARSFEDLTKEAVKDLKPRPDLKTMAVAFNLLRAGNRVQQDLETKVYRPSGLSGAAFNVLFSIFAVGPVTPIQLAHLSSVTPATMSSVLNTLERSELIVRRPSEEDKRSVVVELTEAGREVTAELFQRTNRRGAVWAAALTKDEQKLFAEMLRKIIGLHPPPLPEPETLLPHFETLQAKQK